MSDDIKNIRRALTFTPDLYAYVSDMAVLRNQPFSSVCVSILEEVMRDDLEKEKAS